MAAYGTDPGRYLPPHTSQLATKLSADGIDDCLVCSTMALVNGASLGEATRTPAGHEPSSAALVRTAVRMRKSLDDPDTATHEQQRGPLPASTGGRMVALMWPAYPTLRAGVPTTGVVDSGWSTFVVIPDPPCRTLAAVTDPRGFGAPGTASQDRSTRRRITPTGRCGVSWERPEWGCRQIRPSYRHCEVPVLMLSAEEAFRRLAIGDHDLLAEVADPDRARRRRNRIGRRK